jgi:hypothetical protein
MKLLLFSLFFTFYAFSSYSQFAPKPHYTFSKIIQPASLVHLSPLPSNYYTQNLGFFCKKEIALEKATRIPFKFRLGSIDYCNYLEGKK